MEYYRKIDNQKIKKLLADAIGHAIKRSDAFLTTEHLALACLNDQKTCQLIEKWIEQENIIEMFREYLNNVLNETVSNQKAENHLPMMTTTTSKLLADSIYESYEKGYKTVEPFIIFKNILTKEPQSVYIIDFFSMNFMRDPATFEKIVMTMEEELKEKSRQEYQENELEEAYSIVEELTTDMVKEADNYDPLIGRKEELFFLQKMLCRRLKNNVIIVGHPGVGKTAIVEGLAKRIKKGNVPEKLKRARIYLLSVSNMLAGTKYRGAFEEKIEKLIKALNTIAESGKEIPILFIDEIHTVIGAGSSSEHHVDMANILKPTLAKGKIRVIGATTFDEYHRLIEKDNAFRRRFQTLKVYEPSIDEAKQILKGLIEKFEEYHNVKYDETALNAAVHLTSKYVKKYHLPDKAIDVIDMAGAKNNIVENRKQVIDFNDIVEEISRISGIPKEKMEEREDDKIANLEKELKKHIFGQDHVIEQIVDVIYISHSGLKDGTKPDGVFLFNGPTGTGKTEMAKVLARSLNMAFHRIDMSEYMEQHSVAKLIGAPPGYVGHDQTEGIFYKIIEENPHSVILLDEIEKAHPNVWNILLQIFDYGRIRTSKGKDVDFSNTIFILTGNIGSRYVNRMEIGFERNVKGEEYQTEELKRLFPPELLNRIDAVLTFRSLDENTCRKIIEKFIGELKEKLSHKNIQLNVSDKAMNYLLEKGFDKEMGARPLRRIIDKEVKKLLARYIVQNGNSATLTIDANDGSLTVKSES